MKTKFYTLLTGLLMAACITSYGQEIVSEFYYTCDMAFSYNDLETCSDGSLISGIYCFSSNNGESTGFHVCKFSPDGQLLDSVTFAPAWELYGIPDMPDTFVLPDYRINDADSTLDIVMTIIDADLNILSTTATPILSGFDPNSFVQDYIITSPSGDLIVTYWIGEIFHLARIGINGILKVCETAPGVLPTNMAYTHSADSALNYESFGVFNESSEYFYKLGGYITESYDEPWPLIVYLFDSKLILTDTIVLCDLDGTSNCDYITREHIVPFRGDTYTGAYVLAANIHFPDDTYSTSLIKYDTDNNFIAFTAFEYGSSTLTNTPVNTVVTDDNQIYHTYIDYPNNYSSEVHLVHLDENLNIVWNITLPPVINASPYGNILKVLPNGDIAVSMASYRSYSTRLYIFIVHDNDPSKTTEIVPTDAPFSLYPNPVKDHLTLRFDDGDEPESVELYDLAGRLVGTKSNGLESIDMGAMPSGVYMLRITMKNGMNYYEKIIKE